MRERFLNIALRIATLLIRFVFLLSLAKHLSAKDVGYFGLFSAAIIYSISIIGLDFYIYSNREAVSMSQAEIGQAIKGQAAISGMAYLLYTPVVILILYHFSSWPLYLIALLPPILILEYCNQEIYRLLIAKSEQLPASILLFVRQASWCAAATVLLYTSNKVQNILPLLFLWLLAGIGAIFLGWKKLNRMGLSGWDRPINWEWVRKGIVTSLAFLLATLALRAIDTFDRFMLAIISNTETVGIYVFFIGICGSLIAFLDAGVYSFSYPLLIKSHRDGDVGAFKKQMLQMLYPAVLMCALFTIASIIFLPKLLLWVGKDLYINSFQMFYWILVATIINALALIPHFALYALGRDRDIIHGQILALLLFIVGTFLLKDRYGALAIPQSLSLSFFGLLIYKSYFYITAANSSSQIVRRTSS